MAIVTFDTQKYLETLTQAGVPEVHAKAMLEAERVIQGTSDLATKADLRQVETVLKADLRQVETALKADLHEVENALKIDLREVETALKADLRQAETAFKTDLRKVETALKTDLREAEAKLHIEIADVKSDVKLLKWMLSVVVAGIVALVMKAFLHG